MEPIQSRSRAIWLVANDKGGVGKTTLAAQLAAQCAMLERSVTLIDSDIHKDNIGWCAARASSYPNSPQIRALHVTDGIGDVACEEYERGQHVLLDVGGRDAEVLRVAMSVAHVMVIPLCPAQLDLFSCKRMARRIAECRRWNPNLRALFVVNRAEPNPVLRSMTEDALELCRTLQAIVDTASTVVHRRIAMVRAMGLGLGVHEMSDAGANRAAEEVASLLRDIDPDFVERDQEEGSDVAV